MKGGLAAAEADDNNFTAGGLNVDDADDRELCFEIL